MDLASGQQVKLASGNTPETESIHMLKEGGDLWPLGDGRYRSVLTAQHRHRDIVYIQDLIRDADGGLKLDGPRRIGFDPGASDLIALSGVRFAGDPDRIVFSGLNLSGHQDIYMADLERGRVEKRLMDDLASDRMPVLWQNRVVFSSDRASPDFAYHLFSYDLDSGKIVQLTDSDGNELNPHSSPDGSRLFFESDASGVSNIYEWSETEIPVQLTDVATGVFAPSMAGPDTLLVSGFNRGEYRLHLIPISDVPAPAGSLPGSERLIGADRVEANNLRCVRLTWDGDRISTADLLASEPVESIPYRPAFSLDDFYASSEFGGAQSYNASVFGSEVRFSDILGNHLVGAAVWNGPRQGLKDLSWVVTYWNQHNRLKLGASVYRTSGIYFNLARQDFYIRERAGFNSQFNLFSAFYDHIFDISDRFATFTRYLIADIRGYLPLHRYAVAAGRAALGKSSGKEPEFFFLGGGFFLRGYWNLYSLYGSAYELANAELRLQPMEMMGIEAPKVFEQRGWPIQLALYAEGARTQWRGGRLGPLGSAGISLRLTLALPFVIEYAWYKKNFWEKDGQRDRGVVVTLLF